MNTSPIHDAALDYLARGWQPIPIAYRSKNPGRDEWEKERWTVADVPRLFNGKPQNIGVLLGEPSAWLVDVDLDHPKAVEIGATVLPQTTTIFGRAGKPRSHYLYQVSGPIDTRQFKLKGVGMILEIRSTGGQTIFPPSTHQETGEPIRWDCTGAPATVSPEQLLDLAQQIYARVVEALGTNVPKPPTTQTVKQGPSRAELVERAWKYVTKMDDAISGQGGHNATFAAACECFKFGLTDSEAGEVLRRFNVAKTGDEQWSEKDLDHKLADARERVTAAGEFGCRLREERPQGAAPAKPKGKPRVSGLRIDAGLQDLAAVTGQAWAALHKANSPTRLFRHGARLVRIERGDDGEPVLRELTVDRVRHELARAAEWFAVREGKEGPVERSAKPPIDVAKDLLATPDPELPRLVRVVEAPVFGADGSLLLEPGYHPGSATYYAPAGLQVPPVSESPLADEVSEAVDLLTFDLLGDFPFVGDSERAHAVALLLLPFARDLIGGATPLHLIEAPTEGTGKGLLVDVLTIPALGRPAAAMTEGRDEDEWRKRLTSKLRNGPAFVLIDNLKRKLDSAAVSAAITADSWEDRIMGVSEMARMPVRCAWVATGNNPALSAEITRRCIRIRLDAKSPEPWLGRKFRHDNLGAWALENRGRLVWAALTMIRAWIAAGRPRGDNPRLGRCERWSDAMGGILALARVPDFLANIQDFYAVANADAALHKVLVGAWWDTHGTCKVGTGELWELVHNQEIDLDLGGGSDKSQRTRLGKMVAAMRDRAYIIDTPEGTQETVRIMDAGKFKRASQYQLGRVNV
jgi:hypothetical protein